uniref:Uncharacterized protein n=1 Tax=Sinocyclocheilus rhinocerous TaxID=307959 RepID=A0A673IHK2_9TELE
FEEQLKKITTSREKEVVICGDGRCDSPGHCAKYCIYTFIDVENQKVADFKVISCTQVSSSNAMEIRGFKLHPSFNEGLYHFHQQKNTMNLTHGMWQKECQKLAIVAKRKECGGLGEWIPSIVNHLWWSAQTCEGNAEVLKEKWVSVIHHVTNRHDWPGNRHYHKCSHEPFDQLSERTKLWLSPGSEAHKALVRAVKDKRLLKDLDHLMKCIHTTTLEVCLVINSVTEVASKNNFVLFFTHNLIFCKYLFQVYSMYLKYLPKRTQRNVLLKQLSFFSTTIQPFESLFV